MNKGTNRAVGWGAMGLAGLLVIGACGSTTDTATSTTTTEESSSAPAETAPAETTPAETTLAETTATVAQENALRAAEQYLATMAFSKAGLIEQLSSEYGSGYEKADAKWAVAQLDVDWNEQAVKAGQAYLDTMPFSRAALIEQLSSDSGSKFTKAQATYAAEKLGL